MFFIYFNIRSLSDMWFIKISSLFVGFIFTLFMASFEALFFFSLMRFSLSITSPVAYAFTALSKKPLPNPKWKDSPLCFLLRVL